MANQLRGPGIKNLDASLFKRFAFAEKKELEFRAEAFNIFNHPNFAVPDNDINSPTFGRVFSTSTPERQMQFGKNTHADADSSRELIEASAS